MRRKPGRGSLLLAGISLSVLCAVLVLIIIKKAGAGRREPLNSAVRAAASPGAGDAAYVPTEVNERDITRGTVSYNGKTYRYNGHLSNYLLLGLDRREFADVPYGSAEAGQTDSVFLVSRDRVTGGSTIITIPRDTITPIRAYLNNKEGSIVLPDHISTAYGYGDGRHGSAKNSREAVSNLLGQIRIEGYAVIPLGALRAIARNVDGIRVRVPDDSLEFRNLGLDRGSAMTIDEDNIELFLRTRDIGTDNSALDRMERQKVFIEAFFERAGEKMQEDPSFITSLYLDLKQDMVTNMSTDQFAAVFGGIASGGREEWTVPGEGVRTDEYDEYHVDHGKLYEKMLRTFCIAEDAGRHGPDSAGTDTVSGARTE